MNTSTKFLPKLLLAACVYGACLSCDNKDIPNNPMNPDPHPDDSKSTSIELTNAEKEVASRANLFAWDLLNECIATNSDENISLSPMSASICLSMLANAADGASRDQLIGALGYAGLDIAAINSHNHKLASDICGIDDNVTLILSNSLWLDRAVKPKTDFLNDMFNNYRIESFDIDHSCFAKSVNSWCNEHTNGLIPRILPDDADNDFAILNAMYFKGLWSDNYRFDKNITKKDDFKNADGTVSRPEYMHNLGVYPYYRNETWSAIQIPFGVGAYRYTVILPDQGYTITECLESISGFDPATAYFNTMTVNVSLPKFKISQETNLIDILKRLGVKDIFDAIRADFSNMTDTPLVIGLVKQSVSFDVNEDGAEGSAVTIVGGFATALPDVEPEVIQFVVDRPFIYMISERSSGAILFVGCMNKF